MKIKELAKKHKQYVIDLRRHFHMHPEISWKEENTAKKIKEELDAMGIPNVSIAGTGILATIQGGGKGKTIALRADIDALEVPEKNEIEYKSQNEGVSHACGHDGHTAMLLGAAKILNTIKDKLHGTVKLIFQPAEESVNGAAVIIKEGGLEGVGTIFGIHLISLLPTGLISADKGPRMAAADRFVINVTGKGGHGGVPHHSIDPIVVGSAIVMNLQSVISRQIDPNEPAVITVGSFNAGTRHNVIAGSARMEGTARWYNPDTGKKMVETMEKILTNTARAFGAEAKLEYHKGCPPTINDTACSKRASAVVLKTFGENALIEVGPLTAAEDFGYYQKEIPGVYVFVGASNEKKGASFMHHHEKFNIDEDALEIGTALHAQYALDFLNE